MTSSYSKEYNFAKSDVNQILRPNKLNKRLFPNVKSKTKENFMIFSN